jgi:hypothetical protein
VTFEFLGKPKAKSVRFAPRAVLSARDGYRERGRRSNESSEKAVTGSSGRVGAGGSAGRYM